MTCCRVKRSSSACRRRARRGTVAFANGCFDLLHVGHVRYLESAAQEADVLVVAINDDELVRPLKGADRPMPRRQHRAELVAALRSVDFVVIFPESTVGTPLLSAAVRMCTARAPTTPSIRCPSATSSVGYGGRIAIVGDPEITRRATCWRGLRRRLR